jgi:hypothetical protein
LLANERGAVQVFNLTLCQLFQQRGPVRIDEQQLFQIERYFLRLCQCLFALVP